MPSRHEKQKPKVPELHLKFDTWVEPSDPEFLDALVELIANNGFNPDELVFSGFDGTPLLEGKPLKRNAGIYAMNLTGWRRTLNQPGKNNPAMYAGEVPCIGLYDASQLAEVYLPKHHRKDPIDEDYQDLTTPIDLIDPTISVEQEYEPPTIERVEVGGEIYDAPIDPIYRDEAFEIRDNDRAIKDALKGENLADLPKGYIVEEGVVHRSYPDDPNASPEDALVGIVFFERFKPDSKRNTRPSTQF